MAGELKERLRVQATFCVRNESDDGAYAAVCALIDALNEVANSPECECDMRVGIERPAGAEPEEGERQGAAPRGEQAEERREGRLAPAPGAVLAA